jgi:hypothetical protein
MSAPQPKAYPVYEPMWDAFQQVLLKESKRLAEDIAKALGVPEKPLKDALAKKRKQSAYLIELCEPTETRFQCEALVETTNVAQRCRGAVVYGDRFCPCHIGWNMPETLKSRPTLRRLVGCERDAVYFVDNLTQQLYDTDYRRVGTVNEQKAYVFEIDDGGLNT